MVFNLGNGYKDLLKNFSIPFFLKLTGTISAFLLYQFISSHYGAEGVGIYSLFNVLVSLFAILCTLGMASSTMQFIPKFLSKYEYGNLKRLAWYHFIVSGSLSVLISLVLYLNSSFLSMLFFQSYSNEKLIRIIAVFLPFYTMFLIGNNYIRGLSFIKLFEYFRSAHVQMLGLIGIIIITTYCTSTCSVSRFLEFIEPNYISVLISGVLFSLASILSWSVVFNFLFFVKHEGHNVSEKILTLRNTLSVSFPMLATAFSAIIMDRIDSLMLAYFYSNTEVGLYNVANKLAALVLFLIIPLISSVLTKISSAYWTQNTVKLNELINLTSRIMFWSSILVFFGLLIFSDFLLGLFGDEFIKAKMAMVFLSVGFFCNALFGLVEHLMNLSGNEKNLSLIFGFGLIINICLNYLLIPIYGIEGAAFSTMIGVLVWNIGAGVACSKYFGRHVFYLPFFKL